MSFGTSISSPPPAPSPVNAGQAATDFVSQMANPQFQQMLFNAESTYRPQYTALNQRDLQNTLLGVAPGTAGGFYGTLDLQDMAARRQAQLNQGLQTQNTEFQLAQLGAYGGQARDAYMGMNPGLAGAMGQLEQFGGRQQSGYLNAAGQMAMAPAQYGNVTPNQINQPSGSGYQAVGADQITSGGVMTPERVAAERVAAERVASERIAAGQAQFSQVGGGALGGNLMQQAMNAQQQNPVTAALQQRAQGLVQNAGQLTPEEVRAATQGSREQFAASGRIGDSASVADEALARAAQSRERAAQDINQAQGINQQLLGAQQMGQQFALGVQGQDVSRQQFNAQNMLGAGQFNVQAALQAAQANQQSGLQAALANQGTGLQAALANQQTGLQAALANQNAGMQSQQFNITNAQGVQQANQAANLQAALANQGAFQNAYQFGAGQNMQSQLANAQMGMQAQLANRDFAAQQQQQRFGNLLGVTGMEQSMLGADRSYAQALAGMQGNIAQNALGLIGFGQNAAAIGMGNQQQGFGAQQAQYGMGPQLFNPNAGINLALQNQANLGNYQASTYGAQAAARGAQAQGMGQLIGGVAGGLGAFFCWVAREVYGPENPKWLMFRNWMFAKAPMWFFKLYAKEGPRFAEWIKDKPLLKRMIRRWMDGRIATLAHV